MGGHEKNRLYAAIEEPVHLGHLKFKLEVGDGAQSANYGNCAELPGQIHGKYIKGTDAHVIHIADVLFEEAHAGIDVKYRNLAVILRHRYDDLVEEEARAFNYVEMTVSDGVESARI